MNADYERLLREATITENSPGTVVGDFQTLLDFIGVEGIPTGAKTVSSRWAFWGS